LNADNRVVHAYKHYNPATRRRIALRAVALQSACRYYFLLVDRAAIDAIKAKR